MKRVFVLVLFGLTLLPGCQQDERLTTLAEHAKASQYRQSFGLYVGGTKVGWMIATMRFSACWA